MSRGNCCLFVWVGTSRLVPFKWFRYSSLTCHLRPILMSRGNLMLARTLSILCRRLFIYKLFRQSCQFLSVVVTDEYFRFVQNSIVSINKPRNVCKFQMTNIIDERLLLLHHCEAMQCKKSR